MELTARQPTVDLDDIRLSLAADVVLLLVPLAPDRLRLVSRAGGAGEAPDEVIAPQGSLLARILAGAHSGRVPRLPLLSGTARRSRSYGPALVVSMAHPEFGNAVLVVARRQQSRPFEDGDLARVRELASSLPPLPRGLTLTELDALGGEATFREAFEVAALGMSLVDPTLRYRWVNGPLCDMLGRRRSELIGTPVTETVHPEHLGRATAFYERLRRGEPATVRDRLRFQRPDGSTVWADAGGSVVNTAPSTPLYLVQQLDATADQDAAEALAHRAMHDEMTGLANRVLFRDRLQALLARGLRGGACAAVFFLDLDRFKDVNDGWGHAAGDKVLTETARRLAAVVRAGDTVARYGGDEFVVAGEVTGVREASQLASRIAIALRPGVFIGGGRTIPVSASIGVALSRPLDSPEELVGRADTALLEAKARRLRVAVPDLVARIVVAEGAAEVGELASVVRPDFGRRL